MLLPSSPNFTKRTSGFTLIELMVVVAIVAILAAIAYPSYTRFLYRTRRVEAKELLTRLASAQEKHLNAFNRYATSISAAPLSGGLGLSTATMSENGYYDITVATAADGMTYTLTATPAEGSRQAADVCGALGIDNALNKTYAGEQTNGNCW